MSKDFMIAEENGKPVIKFRVVCTQGFLWWKEKRHYWVDKSHIKFAPLREFVEWCEKQMEEFPDAKEQIKKKFLDEYFSRCQVL